VFSHACAERVLDVAAVQIDRLRKASHPASFFADAVSSPIGDERSPSLQDRFGRGKSSFLHETAAPSTRTNWGHSPRFQLLHQRNDTTVGVMRGSGPGSAAPDRVHLTRVVATTRDAQHAGGIPPPPSSAVRAPPPSPPPSPPLPPPPPPTPPSAVANTFVGRSHVPTGVASVPSAPVARLSNDRVDATHLHSDSKGMQPAAPADLTRAAPVTKHEEGTDKPTGSSAGDVEAEEQRTSVGAPAPAGEESADAPTPRPRLAGAVDASKGNMTQSQQTPPWRLAHLVGKLQAVPIKHKRRALVQT